MNVSGRRGDGAANLRGAAEWPTWMPPAAIAALTALVITLVAPNAWLTLVLDGLPVAVLLLGAIGFGWYPARWLLPPRVREGEAPAEPLGRAGRVAATNFDPLFVPLAAGTGLAIIGDVTLLLGCFGATSQAVSIGIVAIGILIGLIAYASESRAAASDSRPGLLSGRRLPSGTALPHIATYVPLVIPLALLAVGATLPPGMLWMDEARAYDALEYHLQVPREYVETGRITYLPHNVYSNFPQQVEILYYFLMLLRGDVRVAAVSAQLLHGALSLVGVWALRAAVPDGVARRIASILAIGTPWLAYLGVLAYVESGLLLYTSLALALLLPVLGTGEIDRRALLAAGLCAGWAAGCKYTAVIIVAVALALGLLVCLRGRASSRLRAVAWFGGAALVAFSPWMIRNVVFTGNPVYPLAWSVFGGRDWSEAQNTQWNRGHAVQGAAASAAGRAGVALQELIGRFDSQRGFQPSLFGPLLVAGALISALKLRDRRAAFLLVWIAVAIGVWATTTQMPARFLTPLLAPLVCLWSLAAANKKDGVALRGKIALGAAVLSSILGAVQLARLWYQHDAYWKSASETSLASFSGAADVFAESHPLNRIDAPHARFWLIGDAAVFHIARPMHYTVVFNRDPWVELVKHGASDAELIDWLRERGWTHVVFNWSEISRLRATYGFADAVTPELSRRLVQAGMTRIEHEGPRDLEILAVPRPTNSR